MKTPQAITKSEWKRIMQIPNIKRAFEVRKNESAESLSQRVLGVKFEHPSIHIPFDALYILTDGHPFGVRVMLYRCGNQLWVGNGGALSKSKAIRSEKPRN